MDESKQPLDSLHEAGRNRNFFRPLLFYRREDPLPRTRPSCNRVYSPSPAIDDACLDPHVILPDPGKVRIQIFHLSTKRNVVGELIIRAATQRHRKTIERHTAGTIVLSAKKHLGEGRQRSVDR